MIGAISVCRFKPYLSPAEHREGIMLFNYPNLAFPLKGVQRIEIDGTLYRKGTLFPIEEGIYDFLPPYLPAPCNLQKVRCRLIEIEQPINEFGRTAIFERQTQDVV